MIFYLGWQALDLKKPAATNITEACAAYAVRFGAQPNVVLVHESDAGVVVAGVEIRALARVQKSTYHVGKE